MKGQVTSIAAKIDALFEMANQGKGGLWMFNSGLVFAGGLIAWLVEHFVVKGPEMNFEQAFDALLGHEGGYSDHP